MSERESTDGNADEDMTIRLLRLAGPRTPVPATREARVRAAVQARWEEQRRQRALRRRILFGGLSLAAAATLALVVGRIATVDRRATPRAERVGTVERIEGTPRRMGPVESASDPGDNRLSAGDPIRIGEWIETDGHARVALRYVNGSSVRFDEGSRARLLSSEVIELSAGAVYIDTGGDSGRFQVRTPVATASNVGTQFEVRVLDHAVRLRVRSGVVVLKDGARAVTGRGGTEVTLANGRATSREIAPHGADWDWTAAVSPALDIGGRALSSFLAQITREHGWTLRYEDPVLARQASGIVIRGSVRGLPPQQAVEVAIATSGLQWRLENGELLIFR